MNEVYEKLQKCYASVREKTDFRPKVALVLGSGLGDYADEIKVETIIDYHDIEGFPVSTVDGHKGRFVFGYIDEVPTVIMQGRVHYYEGYAIQDVVLPTRLMKMLGAEVLFLTNAAGSVNREFLAGDFMMIIDQITSFVPSPLVGKNIDELGLRFSDMSEVYNKDLQEILRGAAKDLGIDLKEGAYIQLTGPQFETPAEVRMCRSLGADAVGMSTACEDVGANHMNMKICGISCISNLGAGLSDGMLTNEEVYETSARVAAQFKQLITESIIRIGRYI